MRHVSFLLYILASSGTFQTWVRISWVFRLITTAVIVTVISERYGLSFFGCILTIGAIYLFVTFGPNSHEQLEAENIVKHIVAWPVLLYLVRTAALSFFSLFCVTVVWDRHFFFWCRTHFKLSLTQCRLNGHLYDIFTGLCICQGPDLSQECAQMRPIRGSSWAFMSVLWPAVKHPSFMQAVIMSQVIFTILQTAAVTILKKISARIRSSDETCSFSLTVSPII